MALSRDPLRRPTCMYYIYYCIYFTFIPAQLNIYACIYLHFTLRIKTFVVAYNNIYPCIYPHLCSHFLTYVFAFVIKCSTFVVTYIRACLTFVVTYMVQARQMCFYWTVFCRNTYNLSHNKCKRMHSDMHRYMPPYATTNA